MIMYIIDINQNKSEKEPDGRHYDGWYIAGWAIKSLPAEIKKWSLNL